MDIYFLTSSTLQRIMSSILIEKTDCSDLKITVTELRECYNIESEMQDLCI